MVGASSIDAEWVGGLLASAGVGCQITRVETESAFGAALHTRTWDLVVADHAHAAPGALKVLEMIRTIDADLPCVVISVAGREEDAVEAMRAGARDVVSKSGIGRLPHVVRREMTENAGRRALALVQSQHLERDRRLHDARVTLFELLRSTEFTTGNDLAVCRALTELVSTTLGVDRVSIWMFDEARTHFRCIESFDQLVGEHECGRSYEIDESPEYFRALDQNRFVEAHAPREDTPAAGEGGRELEVSSQLDAAIRVTGNMVGALCLDHVGEARRWGTD